MNDNFRKNRYIINYIIYFSYKKYKYAFLCAMLLIDLQEMENIHESSLIDCDNYEGWFPYTIKQMEERLYLNPHDQDRILDVLFSERLIEKKIMGGQTRVRHFRLNIDKMSDVWHFADEFYNNHKRFL